MRRRPTNLLPVLAAVLAAALVGGCGPAGASPSGTGSSASSGRVEVVATTTVFADLVRQVGGDRVTVSSLVPAGVDVHTFDPRPADAVRVAKAQLAVMNGLGLDDWLERLIASAGAGSLPVVKLAVDLPGVTYLAGTAEPGVAGGVAAHGSAAPGGVNPHLWLNVAYAKKYVERIATALARVDPAGAPLYADRSAAYASRLDALDAEIRADLAQIPSGNRRIVSYHDAFPYFAAAYGVTVVGNVVAAPGQEPSAGEVAALIDAIRSSGVRAVLTEVQFNPALAETVARETGVTIVGDLYTGTLGPPPADTYVGMMRWDVARLVGALT